MKSLYDMTIGERIALTVVIVLVIIFMLALAGWMTGGWDEYSTNAPLFELESSSSRRAQLRAQEPLYPDDLPIDGRLLALDKRALDEAYHEQILLLFSVWLKQQAGDSTNFNNGLRIARRAYKEAADRIQTREQATPRN